ncbi:MAG TPA: hypothetical protein VGX76_02320, partial [Pirellulales bacterium]|nr:hypothetical protein [Pirellulales bacterium]
SAGHRQTNTSLFDGHWRSAQAARLSQDPGANVPNESVTCPSCGSPCCTESRANAFVCQNCDGTFRWLNPTEFTVVHCGSTCACGRRSLGGCTLCRAGVCKKHHATWHALLSSWRSLKRAHTTDRGRGWLQRCVDGVFSNDWRERPSLCRLPVEVTAPVLKQLKLDRWTDVDLLCLPCTEALFAKLFRPVEDQIGRLGRAGRLCGLCLAEHRQMAPPRGYEHLFLADECLRCNACRMTFCMFHTNACRSCKTIWCESHAPPDGFEGCCRCAPPSRLRRFFARRFGLPIHAPKVTGRS